MTGYYTANPHYAAPDFTEDRERLERCEELAGAWFKDLTGEQLATFNETMQAIAPYKGSPRWDREHKAVQFVWEQTTAEASRIYRLALRDLMTTGEISEATAYAFDAVQAGQVMQLEAAE